MPSRSYRKPGLILKRNGLGTAGQIKDLQRDLRALGYLRQGIDGAFGQGTKRAVKALQHDLLSNQGGSSKSDGRAPVAVSDYNRARVANPNGVLDQKLAAVIGDIHDDDAFPKLPSSDNAAADNAKVKQELATLRSKKVPIPFLRAIFRQESGGKHYNVPTAKNSDNFIVVGLDTNATQRHVITSRGYGVGQYTLFHHPPRPDEVSGFMLVVKKNIEKAVKELREKFDHFVAGPSGGTRADDRIKEIGNGPLRVCKFDTNDPRFLTDCRQCLLDAGQKDIKAGVTRWFAGSSNRYEPTQYYKKADYQGVPIRSKIGCDWPYAMRRYNGSGSNSYHYQSRVLLHLLKQTD